MTRLIKRYDNRKLYDIQTSKTVTLSEIAEMIRIGDEVQVVDSSGKDISTKVLAQIFFQENVETKQMVFNKYLLQGLIKETQNMENTIKKFLLGGIGLASLTGEKIEELVNELVKRGEVAEDDRAKFVKNLMEKSSSEIHKVVDKVSTGIKSKEETESEEEERVASLESQIEKLQTELKELQAKKDEQVEEPEPKAKATSKNGKKKVVKSPKATV